MALFHVVGLDDVGDLWWNNRTNLLFFFQDINNTYDSEQLVVSGAWPIT